jgi:iron complex transport system ATP-binding protein
MNKLLDIRHLNIGYDYPIKNDINLQLSESQFVCLIGPNGIGKSTLLKTISKTVPAISGSIKVLGKTLKELSTKEISKLISLVLTDYIETFNLTAIDVIRMGRYPHTGFWGNLNNSDKETINKTVDKLQIGHLINRQYGELSDGEKQKILIAKALVQDAPIMLLDEPTAFLDFPTKASLFVLLKKLVKISKMGIIISTHDIELALKTADQIWLFTENNRLIKGIPEDLVLDGHINQVFNNKDIQFNIKSGHFEKNTSFEKVVAIDGQDSIEMFWLKKSLIRNEIGVSKVASLSVSYIDQFVISSYENDIVKCNTIEDTIKEILKML